MVDFFSGHLEEFVSGNPLGTIVVSFGSIAMASPQHVMEKLLRTFKR